MLFMVIERFRDNDMVPVYRRLREAGRSLPDGLEYIDSWVEPNFSRCFQLMRCDDARLFQEWALSLRGYGVSLEIIPVVSSAETRAVVAPWLDNLLYMPLALEAEWLGAGLNFPLGQSLLLIAEKP